MKPPRQPVSQVVERFESAGGAQVFQIPLEVFPGFWGFAYLALVNRQGEAYRVLIDSGSGFGVSNQNLEAGLEQSGRQSGQDVRLENLTHVLITHGHIDHFGGLSYVRPRTDARIGVHERDVRNLTNYEERLVIVTRRLREYLVEAGVAPGRLEHLLEMYNLTKSLYHSIRVDFTYEAAGMALGPFEMLHVPGHCAGHVAIRLDDLLFSGDHVLEETSPHQSPEQLTASTGLDHYLKSLDNLRGWAKGIRLTLGGHKQPVTDLHGRIRAIEELHHKRLQTVLDILNEPDTVAGVSKKLFGEVNGYNVLLALEEAGAHVEYLYQRGYLEITNLEEIGASSGRVPIYYRRLSP